ncbi:hypothetical protein ACFFX1_55375 [Dactylosporangium sucinum]|uniref:Uncharacterized protein n=1 Tax=Dactylosporangium sucinum TaxID=1424081 RepID=A0A917U3N0_9ACTN|nr:hypothetical protein [Dactylosporangium sucinum]GGM52746.1 hypothetical protein GCM10007977_062890 [Dactylosporangium sucinum]
MRPLRCGTGVPLDQLPEGDRRAVEDFARFLSGELALAADGQTYVDAGDPRAVHVAPRPGPAPEEGER